MKKTISRTFFAACIAFALISCGAEKEKDDKNVKVPPQDTAHKTTTTETSGEKKGMSVSEAKDFLDADEANKGREVTVSAYSWGSNGRMGGEIQLNLGDKKLEGMQSASFSCIFGKDQADAIKAIAKDAMVTVTGKISKGAGGVQLNECKLVQ